MPRSCCRLTSIWDNQIESNTKIVMRVLERQHISLKSAMKQLIWNWLIISPRARLWTASSKCAEIVNNFKTKNFFNTTIQPPYSPHLILCEFFCCWQNPCNPFPLDYGRKWKFAEGNEGNPEHRLEVMCWRLQIEQAYVYHFRRNIFSRRRNKYWSISNIFRLIYIAFKL